MKTILNTHVESVHKMIYAHIYAAIPAYANRLQTTDITVIVINDALRSCISLDRLKRQLNKLNKLNNHYGTKHVTWYLDTLLPPIIMDDYMDTIAEYAHNNPAAFKQKFLALCSDKYKAQLLLDGGYA